MLKVLKKDSVCKRLISLVVAVLMTLSLVACRNNNGNEKPKSEIKGYYSSAQTYNGGRAMENANLKDVTVSYNGAVAEVKLAFAKADGGGALAGVPKYTISMLGGIPRLMISFDALQRCDFADKSEESGKLIQGVFKQVPDAGKKAVIYIQLANDCAYKVEESGGVLIIKIQKTSKTLSTSYYVLVDAFNEFKEGELDSGSGLTPVQCVDAERPILISEAFFESTDADEFAQQMGEIFTDRRIVVVKVQPGGIPSINEQPKGANGFYTDDQRYIGGALTKNANLKDISVSVNSNDETVIAFKFVKGSVRIDGAESELLSIPSYSVECIGGIPRLKVSFASLDYWDFYRQDNWNVSPLISGIFKQIPSGSTGGMTVYVQLTNSAVFSVSEASGVLNIRIKAADKKSTEGYYITSNSFDNYQNGSLSNKIGLTPVLCSDAHSIIIISQPYKTEAEAKAAMENIKTEIPVELMKVVKLNDGALPVADDDIQDELKNIAVSQTGQVRPIFPSGRFLTMHPDGMNALFARPLDTSEEAVEIAEELWLLNLQSNQKKRLSEIEFASIMQAQFSVDGSKIAFIEQSGENNILSILSVADGQIISLTENGLGMNTSGFAWGDDSENIYTISGDENLAIKHTKLGATPQITTIKEVTSMSRLERVGRKLYFIDANDVADSLQCLDLETNQTAEVGVAEDFRIAPDGMSAAVIGYSGDDNDSMTRVSVIQLTGSATKTVVTDKADYGFFYGADSLLYYMVDASATEDKYSTEIYCYDSQMATSSKVLNVVTNQICAGPDSKSLMAFVAEHYNNKLYVATYLLTHN